MKLKLLFKNEIVIEIIKAWMEMEITSRCNWQCQN